MEIIYVVMHRGITNAGMVFERPAFVHKTEQGALDRARILDENKGLKQAAEVLGLKITFPVIEIGLHE